MRQAAALPYRSAQGAARQLEVLLVTSSSNRWIIPKGDIDDGMKPHVAAEKEAFEEGGVRGRIGSRPIGTFRTSKEQNGAAISVEVEVFPLEVTEQLDRWPEMKQRERKWLPIGEAVKIAEAELASIMTAFARLIR